MMKQEPPWVAWLKTRLGLAEFKGEPDNPAIIELWRLAGLKGHAFTQDETPWCAAAVGAALEATGFRGTRDAMARSYERWPGGFRIGRPVYGAITVLDRNPPHPSQGHVGLLVGLDAKSIALLGGNQNDAVTVAVFPRSRIRTLNGVPSFWWPATHEAIRPEWLVLPAPSEAQGEVKVS